MRKLILLTGLHKTGTTSIQATCRVNLERLRASGILYPLFESKVALGGRPENHSRVIGRAFRRSMARAGNASAGERASIPNRDRQSSRDLLLSALEDSERLDVLLVAESVSNFTEDELEDMRSWLRVAGFEVHAYCCIRGPIQWLHSLVAQRCFGEFAPRLTIGAAVTEFARSGSILRERVLRVRKAFPETAFFDFGSAIHHPGGPPGRFLELLGIQTAGWRILRANEGGSDAAVRLASYINEEIARKASSPERFRHHVAFLEERYPALRRIPGAKFQLRSFEAQPLIELLENENQWLKTTFGASYGDAELVLSGERPLLTQEQRRFIEEHLSGAVEPLSRIVKGYLAKH